MISDNSAIRWADASVSTWESKRSWKTLADQFQKKTWTNCLSLRRKLHSLKLKDGVSVQSHIKEMTDI